MVMLPSSALWVLKFIYFPILKIKPPFTSDFQISSHAAVVICPSNGNENMRAVVVQLMSVNQLYKNHKMAKLVLFSTA